jgi:hypothetical protein
LALDIRYLHREALPHPGQTLHCTWSRDGKPIASIAVSLTADAVPITFEWRPRDTGEWTSSPQCLPVTWTALHPLSPHCRGIRPWFLCPQITANGQTCGRRVAVLYASGGRPYFACRKCRRLAYAIEQENPRHRSIRRAQRARLRLGGSPSLLDPLPPRPKGMRTHTYNRLLGKALIAAERWVGLQLARLPHHSGPVQAPSEDAPR